MSEPGMDTSPCGLNFTDVCLVSATALISFRKAFHSATFEKYMLKINKKRRLLCFSFYVHLCFGERFNAFRGTFGNVTCVFVWLHICACYCKQNGKKYNNCRNVLDGMIWMEIRHNSLTYFLPLTFCELVKNYELLQVAILPFILVAFMFELTVGVWREIGD